jgi:nitroreductase
MELREAMSTLRAVRKLRPDPIPEVTLHRIVEAATGAPTGGNTQPWRVVVVRDEAARTEIGRLYAGRWRAYADGRADVVASLPEPARTRTEKMLAAGDHLAEHFAACPALLVFCFAPEQMAITDAHLDRPSIVGGASVYPAVQNALLACRDEGIGCTLTTLLCADEEHMRPLLGIPEGWYTACVVPIGLPLLGGHGPITRRPVAKQAFADRWDAPFGGG